MLISLNPEPNKEIFQSLLNNTLDTLDTEAKRNQEVYLKHLGNKLENVVAEIMTDKAHGTPFENSIELISGQRFPDIIANRYYGVEVKTTKQNHWTTTGNSVLEGTRVEGIERIYMLFGKMYSPIEFKYRPYEDCLSEVVVTHSPRYLINMDLPKGQTIFDKLNIPYDILRKSTNPIKPIIEFYRNSVRGKGEVWWLDKGEDTDEDSGKSIIIKFWNSLPIALRKKYIATGFVFFPEVLKSEFNRFAFWLYENESIICPNVRDQYSAGGTGKITLENKTYSEIPKVIMKLTDSLADIKDILNNAHDETLSYYWEKTIKDKWSNWIYLIIENTKHMKLSFDLEKYIKEKIEL